MKDNTKKQKKLDADIEQKLENQTTDEYVQDEIKEEKEVDARDARIADLEDQLKRAVADYRNLEARNRDAQIEFIKYSNKSLIEQLLPAFDTLLLAEKYTEDENLKITVKHILEVLKNAGVEKVETKKVVYNPSTMEAIEVVEGDKNAVIEEAQPGFTLNGKVIRPARVKVGKGS